MNLGYDEEIVKKDQSGKILAFVIGGIVILVFVLIALLMYMSSIKKSGFKFYVDSEEKSLTASMFKMEDEELYINISEIAKVLGYEVNNGEYKKYNEDVNSCYVMNAYEVAGFKANSTNVYKVVREYDEYEYFKLKQKTKIIDGKLYTTSEGVELAFNTKFEYNTEKNYVSINTLDNLINTYASKLNNTVITSDKMSFSNKKAIKYGMVLVNNTDNLFGVKKINGENILGTKYSELQFLESSKDFIVTTPEGKQGIISLNNGVSIEPQYEEIKQLDIDYDLYIVKLDGKYGVINRAKGARYVIWPQYDAIGIDGEKFKNEDFSNPYIFYDNCIPVKVTSGDKKEVWTIFDKEGKNITNTTYDGLGFIKGTSKQVQGNNVLLVPEREGIIVYKDGFYGLINSTGRLLLPIQLKEVYTVTSNGKTSYYMVYGEDNKTENMLDFLTKVYGAVTPKTESTTTNTGNNENNNNTQNNNSNDTNQNNTTNNENQANNAVQNNNNTKDQANNTNNQNSAVQNNNANEQNNVVQPNIRQIDVVN